MTALTDHSGLRPTGFALLAALMFAPAFASAQQGAPQSAPAALPAEKYEPKRGESGKDVMWIPSPETLIELMLDKAAVTKDDIVYDLGSGDGRTVIAAAKRGATAFGIEFNPKMVAYSKDVAEKAGVKATFIHGDIFVEDFSRATVVTLFLLDELNYQLRPKILGMKPGTRIVSNTFHMGDWEPDATIGPTHPNCGAYCSAFFWLVPAKAEGAWQTDEGALNLKQTFQMLQGTLGSGASERAVKGKLAGNALTLDIAGETFTGEVSGDRLTLAAKDGAGRLEGKR